MASIKIKQHDKQQSMLSKVRVRAGIALIDADSNILYKSMFRDNMQKGIKVGDTLKIEWKVDIIG